MSDNHHRYYKHAKFRQNPRGDPKFLVDLTWNDPYAIADLLKCPTICLHTASRSVTLFWLNNPSLTTSVNYGQSNHS